PSPSTKLPRPTQTEAYKVGRGPSPRVRWKRSIAPATNHSHPFPVAALRPEKKYGCPTSPIQAGRPSLPATDHWLLTTDHHWLLPTGYCLLIFTGSPSICIILRALVVGHGPARSL